METITSANRHYQTCLSSATSLHQVQHKVIWYPTPTCESVYWEVTNETSPSDQFCNLSLIYNLHSAAICHACEQQATTFNPKQPWVKG